MGISDFFRKSRTLVDRAYHGLKEHVGAGVLSVGVDLARKAETQFVDNSAKREWVVRQLTAKGWDEHVARLVVEIAVFLIKKELA